MEKEGGTLFSYAFKVSRGSHVRAALAALVAFVAGGLVTGMAEAAPKPRLLKVAAPGRMVQGSQYVVRAKIHNPAGKRVKGTVAVTLSANRKPGPVKLGGRRQSLKPKSATSVSAGAKVRKSVATGEYYLVACFRSDGARSCAARPVKVLPVATGPQGPAGPAGPAYGVGAQTTTPPDPVFPNVGNSGYDVQHYNLTLNYDCITNEFLTGTNVKITAKNTRGTGLFQYSLDFAGPTVTNVKVNGVDADFWRETGPAGSYRNKLVIEPDTKVKRDATFVTEVSYEGTPVQIIDPDNSPEGWLRVSTADFQGAFVVNEPIGAMGWYPNNNTPSDKATFEFHNTVATTRIAIANGELTSRVGNGDGTWTWNWEMTKPMAPFVSTSSVGNYEYAAITGTLTGMTFHNAISNNNTAAQKTTIMNTVNREDAIINQLATRFGVAYPFDSAGVVVDQLSGVGYALEVQSRVHFPTRSISAGTLAHENTHQWFGNSVTGTNWHELWLHEGWATWGAWWWGNAFNGSPITPASAFKSKYTRGSGTCPGSNKWCTPPAKVTGRSLFDTFPTYTRPGMMFEAQNQVMGPVAFQNLITQWQTRYRYGNATRADWIALTKEMDGNTRDARWDEFFTQWLDGKTMPTINPGNFGSP